MIKELKSLTIKLQNPQNITKDNLAKVKNNNAFINLHEKD